MSHSESLCNGSDSPQRSYGFACECEECRWNRRPTPLPLDPDKRPLTMEMLDAAVEAFLTEEAAGTVNEHGETGPRRDVRNAIEAALAAALPGSEK